MNNIEETTRYFHNLHKDLHGSKGYDRRYVIKDIKNEIEIEEFNENEMIVHCILDELEEEI